MKPITINTKNKELKDIKIPFENWEKFEGFTITSFRICGNILISISGKNTNSSILGTEQMEYHKITEQIIKYISKFL